MMEFLNNIWVAVSTPNPCLIKLLSVFFSIFIESPLILLLIRNTFRIKITKKQALIYILSISIVAIANLLFIKWPFNILINYVVQFLVFLLVFKLSLIKTLIISIYPSIIFILVETLMFNPYLRIFNISYDDATTIPIYRIPFAILMYLVIFIFAMLIKFKNIKITLLDEFDKKTKSIIALNFIFGLIYIIVQVLLTVTFIDVLSIPFTIFNFISILAYFCISIYSLTKVIKLTNTTKQLESAEEYNKTLHILHDNVRCFKHDFDNIVTTIGGYINTDDMEGLKKYYIQLEHDCEKVNNLYLLNPDSINNPGIYNLITSKYNEAIEKDIDINLYFLMDLNELNMKIYEFGRILGILLDNAIEAAEYSKEKIINISFRREEKNKRNVISIENSYSNKDVDTEHIFNKGITEKENHLGIGLWEVRKIISKNSNVNLFTSKTDEFFKQQLEIYFN